MSTGAQVNTLMLIMHDHTLENSMTQYVYFVLIYSLKNQFSICKLVCKTLCTTTNI